MCDYSLNSQRSRHAHFDDHLVTKSFGFRLRGFVCAADADMTVCVFPGTELAFDEAVTYVDRNVWSFLRRGGSFRVKTPHRTAIFRQLNNRREAAERDALEFPDGRIVHLTSLVAGQKAKVLQLPVLPRGLRAAQNNRTIRTVV